MPLYRRRESVTADEVIAKLRTFDPSNRASAISVEAIIMVIEETVKSICSKNGIQEQ